MGHLGMGEKFRVEIVTVEVIIVLVVVVMMMRFGCS
jgi:phage shock protein PspC (stress-responsive transcriptional regulator)